MKQSIHAKRMARHHKRLKKQAGLNLVSLMDIFTILVFFLLVNSSEVDVLQSNKDIKLPESIAEQKPENNLMILVDDENIIVGGRTVAKVDAVMKNKDVEIKSLLEELEYLAKRKKERLTQEEIAKGLDITIMGDKEIPYTLLKKIMTTSAKADYRNISLAVSQVPDENAPKVGEG